MPSPADTAWDALTAHMDEAHALGTIAGLVEWDQQCWMPASGAALRGRQKALLAKLRHERMTDPRVGEWLATIAADPATAGDPVRSAAVRNLGRAFRSATALPARLVQEQAEATSAAFGAWRSAREADDFAPFAPALERVIALAREQAACLADAAEAETGAPLATRYDALLREYDPGVTVADLDALFAPLTAGLVDLLDRIRGAAQGPREPEPLAVPVDAQRRIHARVCRALGFDLDRGRLDEAAHPFTMGMVPDDVRLTTRYFEGDLLQGLLGTIHEAGHGMYEQGLPATHGGVALAGTGVDSAASTGLHESQSRFWENTIGRSAPFLRWLAGVVREEAGIDADGGALFRHANRVEPSFIRVEADEVTYNLHIALRFRLEVALLSGDLAPADLPGAWDERMEALLGIRPSGPARGVLQDVHWSAGLIGYFPSYTLGNLYAAALSRRLFQDVPDLWDRAERAELAPVLSWLRTHVHDKGHLVDGAELVADVTGAGDQLHAVMVESFLDHVEQRHGRLYGV